MSSESLQAPRSPELPMTPPAGFWSETQWDIFWAVMDSIIPAIVSKPCLTDGLSQLGISDAAYSSVMETARHTKLEKKDEASLQAFLQERLSTSPAVRETIIRITSRLPVKQQEALGTFLSSLASSIGAFLMTGSCIPFHQQSTLIREAVIQGWHVSWLSGLRRASRALVRIAQIAWLMSSPMFRQVVGYPEVPLNWKPAPDFDFAFLQPGPGEAAGSPSAPSTITIETDIVIVGSGCGGAVCAKILAEAGHRVLVVDKGYYFPPSQLPMPGTAASRYLFDRAVNSSVDTSISIIAGATWGGGGTVNWSVSLRTQDAVRKEWATDEEGEGGGLGFFAGPEYEACMDRVCERMGVSTEPVVQTHRGRVLLEGSRKLGWRADVCPQNTGGKEHSCGHCTMGCGSGEKQGPATCWLPDAARAGAEFMEGFDVEKILFEEGEDVNNNNKRTATGVAGTWTARDEKGTVSGAVEERVTRKVMIKAKKVIVSCGALWTPMLLLRSGLTNPQIGRNLRLHPCYTAGGFFMEDTKPWEGAIITSYCSELEDLDGHGHGVKLETTNMTPYTCLSSLPFRTGLDFKRNALRYRHFDAFISATRDRDSGRVHPDPATGAIQVDYTASDFDRAHTLEGVLALCKIMYIMGAREIEPFVSGVEPFVREDGNSTQEDEAEEEKKQAGGAVDPAFTAWLDKVRRLGSIRGNVGCASAHQMGSCRMSAREDGGVVDRHGKVWGVEGLYVADASVFPSASGVNPMVTVMAIADWIARAVDRDLKGTTTMKKEDRRGEEEE
ncbi:long-chain fatty alcohol dehydrogenase [Cryphonectria parasitica EP155]|uniref:Long-chain-alcohol oxidase n=1 Tax=Cryphonectria parasitica (strain ATCC 38755 / EP155) TaxID=660469 RepID=A0A9P4YBD7_CRYP1|nr:long-chain fatty alcohol dehydrogenase [Cryphonectria parasitica EP155]KAF3769946.1 long-chain fatty alcohol dehydrogenase [Cryphonectria parasitica EP155]